MFYKHDFVAAKPGRSLLVSFVLASLSTALSAEPRFEETSASSGVEYTGGSYGVAWGDIDGDGLPDLWMTNHSEPDHLYRNLGDGTFVRVEDLPLPAVGIDTHGVAWFDVDGDTDLDVFVLSGAAGGANGVPNFLYRNGTVDLPIFEEAAAELGLDYPDCRGRTPNFLDIDNDSDLDAVFNGPFDEIAPPTILVQGADGTFLPEDGTIGYLPPSTLFALHGLLDNERRYLLTHSSNFPGRAYSLSGFPLADEVEAWFPERVNAVQDAALVDLNNDLLPDLFFARGSQPSEFSRPNPDTLNISFRVRNTTHAVRFHTAGVVTMDIFPKNISGGPGPWTLNEIFVGAVGRNPSELPLILDPVDPEFAGVFEPDPAMESIVIGYDVDASRWEVRVSSTGVAPLAELIIVSKSTIDEVTALGFDADLPNWEQKIVLNTGSSFVVPSAQTGAPDDQNCFGVTAADFDNDMDIDIYLACSRSTENLANTMLENLGNGTFADVTDAAGVAGSLAGRSEATAAADIDGDGFLDLLLANGIGWTWGAFNRGPVQIFRNLGNENSWLFVELRGTTSNHQGIGALVFLSTPDGRVQRAEVDDGIHRNAQDHVRTHFGLGPNTTYSEIEIRWPSGTLQRITGGIANRVVNITEFADLDGDGVADEADNCPAEINPDQADADDDNLGDSCDNCIEAQNPDQCDSNDDGYGNRCDADFDGDLSVSFLDLELMLATFFTTSGEPEYDADVDLDCDGAINLADLDLFESLIFLPPGPSALAH